MPFTAIRPNNIDADTIQYRRVGELLVDTNTGKLFMIVNKKNENGQGYTKVAVPIKGNADYAITQFLAYHQIIGRDASKLGKDTSTWFYTAIEEVNDVYTRSGDQAYQNAFIRIKVPHPNNDGEFKWIKILPVTDAGNVYLGTRPGKDSNTAIPITLRDLLNENNEIPFVPSWSLNTGDKEESVARYGTLELSTNALDMNATNLVLRSDDDGKEIPIGTSIESATTALIENCIKIGGGANTIANPSENSLYLEEYANYSKLESIDGRLASAATLVFNVANDKMKESGLKWLGLDPQIDGVTRISVDKRSSVTKSEMIPADYTDGIKIKTNFNKTHTDGSKLLYLEVNLKSTIKSFDGLELHFHQGDDENKGLIWSSALYKVNEDPIGVRTNGLHFDQMKNIYLLIKYFDGTNDNRTAVAFGIVNGDGSLSPIKGDVAKYANEGDLQTWQEFNVKLDNLYFKVKKSDNGEVNHYGVSIGYVKGLNITNIKDKISNHGIPNTAIILNNQLPGQTLFEPRVLATNAKSIFLDNNNKLEDFVDGGRLITTIRHYDENNSKKFKPGELSIKVDRNGEKSSYSLMYTAGETTIPLTNQNELLFFDHIAKSVEVTDTTVDKLVVNPQDPSKVYYKMNNTDSDLSGLLAKQLKGDSDETNRPKLLLANPSVLVNVKKVADGITKDSKEYHTVVPYTISSNVSHITKNRLVEDLRTYLQKEEGRVDDLVRHQLVFDNLQRIGISNVDFEGTFKTGDNSEKFAKLLGLIAGRADRTAGIVENEEFRITVNKGMISGSIVDGLTQPLTSETIGIPSYVQGKLIVKKIPGNKLELKFEDTSVPNEVTTHFKVIDYVPNVTPGNFATVANLDWDWHKQKDVKLTYNNMSKQWELPLPLDKIYSKDLKTENLTADVATVKKFVANSNNAPTPYSILSIAPTGTGTTNRKIITTQGGLLNGINDPNNTLIIGSSETNNAFNKLILDSTTAPKWRHGGVEEELVTKNDIASHFKFVNSFDTTAELGSLNHGGYYEATVQTETNRPNSSWPEEKIAPGHYVLVNYLRENKGADPDLMQVLYHYTEEDIKIYTRSNAAPSATGVQGFNKWILTPSINKVNEKAGKNETNRFTGTNTFTGTVNISNLTLDNGVLKGTIKDERGNALLHADKDTDNKSVLVIGGDSKEGTDHLVEEVHVRSNGNVFKFNNKDVILSDKFGDLEKSVNTKLDKGAFDTLAQSLPGTIANNIATATGDFVSKTKESNNTVTGAVKFNSTDAIGGLIISGKDKLMTINNDFNIKLPHYTALEFHSKKTEKFVNTIRYDDARHDAKPGNVLTIANDAVAGNTSAGLQIFSGKGEDNQGYHYYDMYFRSWNKENLASASPMNSFTMLISKDHLQDSYSGYESLFGTSGRALVPSLIFMQHYLERSDAYMNIALPNGFVESVKLRSNQLNISESFTTGMNGYFDLENEEQLAAVWLDEAKIKPPVRLHVGPKTNEDGKIRRVFTAVSLSTPGQKATAAVGDWDNVSENPWSYDINDDNGYDRVQIDEKVKAINDRIDDFTESMYYTGNAIQGQDRNQIGVNRLIYRFFYNHSEKFAAVKMQTTNIDLNRFVLSQEGKPTSKKMIGNAVFQFSFKGSAGIPWSKTATGSATEIIETNKEHYESNLLQPVDMTMTVHCTITESNGNYNIKVRHVTHNNVPGSIAKLRIQPIIDNSKVKFILQYTSLYKTNDGLWVTNLPDTGLSVFCQIYGENLGKEKITVDKVSIVPFVTGEIIDLDDTVLNEPTGTETTVLNQPRN